MKNQSITTLSSLAALLLISQYSFAQAPAPAPTAAPADAGTALEISYNLGAVTDYRYRGVSQTRLKPALQGGVDVTYGSFYASAWASNIRWIKDAGGNANVEVDLSGGYKYELSKNLTLDVGALMYQYPKNNLSPSANTLELYLGAISGPYSVKYSRSAGNLFGYANSKGSGYLEANLDLELAKGINLMGHVGKQTVKNNSAASYLDYKFGLSYEALGGKFTGAVVKTNIDTIVAGKNLSNTGFVLGYSKTF